MSAPIGKRNITFVPQKVIGQAGNQTAFADTHCPYGNGKCSHTRSQRRHCKKQNAGKKK